MGGVLAYVSIKMGWQWYSTLRIHLHDKALGFIINRVKDNKEMMRSQKVLQKSQKWTSPNNNQALFGFGLIVYHGSLVHAAAGASAVADPARYRCLPQSPLIY